MKTPAKNKNYKLILPIAAAAIIIAAGSAYAITQLGKHDTTKTAPQATTKTTPTSGNSNTQTTGPSDTGTTSNNSTTSSGSNNRVGIVIVDASQYTNVIEVRAYANAIEDGTCTYAFTRGTSTITKQSVATAGASTTSCTTIDIPSSEFTAGNWSLKVTYASKSGKYSGSSASQTVNVR